MTNIQEQRNNRTSTLLAQSLAQAKGFSRSGELLLPRRELEKRNMELLCSLAEARPPRLTEIALAQDRSSSPER